MLKARMKITKDETHKNHEIKTGENTTEPFKYAQFLNLIEIWENIFFWERRRREESEFLITLTVFMNGSTFVEESRSENTVGSFRNKLRAAER